MPKISLEPRTKLLKQSVISFVGAHPRLITFLGAVGISFTFAAVGRVVINEILQPAFAIFGVPCPNCGASEFAPGQEQVLPGGAEDLAPGHVDENSPDLDPKDVAPGQLNKKEIEP